QEGDGEQGQHHSSSQRGVATPIRRGCRGGGLLGVLRERRGQGQLHVLFPQTRYVGDVRPQTDMDIVEVKLVDQPVTDAGLRELAGCKSLHTLHLDGTKVTDAGRKEIASLKLLHTLYLGPAQTTDLAL